MESDLKICLITCFQTFSSLFYSPFPLFLYNTYHNTVHHSFYCDILFHFSLHLLTFLTLPTYSFLPTLSRSLFLTIPSYLPPFHSLFLSFPSYFRPIHSLILPIPSYFPFTLSFPFRNVILSLPYHLSLSSSDQ